MKTKRTIIVVLTAVLVTALIIGCNISLDNANNEKIAKDESMNQPAPEGKIKIRLNVKNSNSDARTVRPSGLPTNVSDFNFFKISILSAGGVQIPPPDNTNAGTGPGGTPGPGDVDYGDYFDNAALGAFSIDLTSGQKYTFTLTGYKRTGSAGSYVYTAQAVGVGETPNPLTATATVTIPLKEITDGSGTGIFEWNVTPSFTDPVAPGGSTPYGSATLSLYALSDTGTPVITEDLISNSNDTAPVSSGYYKMVITLTKTDYQTVYVQEIVHIFAGFTTTYSQALPALRSTKHKITYDYSSDSGYNAGSSSNPKQEYLNHGTAFSNLTNTSPAHSTPSTNIFDQWYTVNTSGVLSSPLVTTAFALKPITLYAKWTPVSQINVLLSPTIAFTTQYDPSLTAAASSFNQADNTIEFTITVNNLGPYDTFTLYKDEGETIIDTVTVDSNAVSVATLTVSRTYNTTNVNWWQEGAHIFYLIASDSNNPAGISDSIEYTLTCN